MDSEKALSRAAVNLADSLAEAIDAHCFEPELGRVWAGLLMAGGDHDGSRIAELLGEDPERVEAVLGELEAFGAVRQDDGDWIAETDLLRIAARFVRERELPLFEELEESLLFARDRLAEVPGEAAALTRDQLQELVRNLGLAKRLLKTVAASERLELDKMLSALSG